VTMHGLALNVDPDLSYYDGIIPCGMLEYGVTSMAQVLGNVPSMEDVKQQLVTEFKRLFIARKIEE